MQFKQVGDILTAAGVKILADFINGYARGGAREGQDPYDRRVQLRELIKPHVIKPEDWDMDYLSYALIFFSLQRATDESHHNN